MKGIKLINLKTIEPGRRDMQKDIFLGVLPIPEDVESFGSKVHKCWQEWRNLFIDKERVFFVW